MPTAGLADKSEIAASHRDRHANLPPRDDTGLPSASRALAWSGFAAGTAVPPNVTPRV